MAFKVTSNPSGVLLRALAKCLLNSDRLERLTILFHGWNRFLVKKCFLVSSLNLPWCSFEPFPLTPLLDSRDKSLRG